MKQLIDFKEKYAQNKGFKSWQGFVAGMVESVKDAHLTLDDHLSKVAELFANATLQEGRNETEWINVDKGLPQVGHKNQVLIYCPQREFDFDPKVITGWMENSYGNNVWCSMHGHSEESLNPSHWKPLPHPPSK